MCCHDDDVLMRGYTQQPTLSEYLQENIYWLIVVDNKLAAVLKFLSTKSWLLEFSTFNVNYFRYKNNIIAKSVFQPETNTSL